MTHTNKEMFDLYIKKVNDMLKNNQMTGSILIHTARNTGTSSVSMGSDSTLLMSEDQWNAFTGDIGKQFPDAKIPHQLKRWYNKDRTYEDVKKLVEKAFNGSNGFKQITEWIRTEPNSLAILCDMINGIDYECEPLFEIPLKDLESENGKQYITFENGKVFACAKNKKFKQTFTKSELLNIPTHYCQFARQLED